MDKEIEIKTDTLDIKIQGTVIEGTYKGDWIHASIETLIETLFQSMRNDPSAIVITKK